MIDSTLDLTNGIYRRIFSRMLTCLQLNSVSVLAELMWYRLHHLADDFGNFLASEDLFANQVFPRRGISPEEVETAFSELSKSGLIKVYSASNERYGHVHGFAASQPKGKNGRRVRRYPSELDHQPLSEDTVSPTCLKHVQRGCDSNITTQDNPRSAMRKNPDESRGIQNEPEKSGNSCAQHKHHQEKEQTHTQYIYLPRDNDSTSQHQFDEGTIVDPKSIERIYRAYPRKVAPLEAKNAIADAIASLQQRGLLDPSAWLLERTIAFADSPAGKMGQYTPYPAKWFKEARYDDDPEEWNHQPESANSDRRINSGSFEESLEL